MNNYVEQPIPEMLKHAEYSEVNKVFQDEEVNSFLTKVENAVKRCTNGEFGKTAQYWMANVKLVERQHLLHYAVKTNCYEIRLSVWKEWMTLCFATNHVHYARYGTYYVNFLENIESTHPGAKEEIEEKGLSVRRNDIGIGQAIDLAGEQTL